MSSFDNLFILIRRTSKSSGFAEPPTTERSISGPADPLLRAQIDTLRAHWLTKAAIGLMVAGAPFVIAAAVNQMIFGIWGLDFLQLANDSDITRSGLALLMRVAPMIAFALISFSALWWHGGRPMLRYALVSAGAFCLIWASALWKSANSWLTLGAFMVVLCAFVASYFVVQPRPHQPPRRIGWFIVIMLIGILALGFLPALIVWKNGFFDYRLQVTLEPKVAKPSPNAAGQSAAACEGWVMWNGEKAMVVDCGPRYQRSRMKVIYGDHAFEGTVIPSVRQPKAR